MSFSFKGCYSTVDFTSMYTICYIFSIYLPTYIFHLTTGRPSLLLSQPPLYSVGLSKTAIIKCSAIGYNVTYRWVIESGAFPSKVIGVNDSTLVIPHVKSSDENTYTCVATAQIGCVSSSTTQIIVSGMITRYYKFYVHIIFYVYTI